MADDQTGQLSAALATTTQRELEGQLENVGQDILVVVDQNGRVFAGASSDTLPPRKSTSLSSLEAVRVALDPNAPADTAIYGVLDFPSRSYSVAAVPLVSAGRTFGAVLLGERIDSAYLARVKALFDGKVVIAV